MHEKIVPFNEDLRQAALNEYDILDSGADKDYDELTYLASQICQVPIAQISIIDNDKVWHKSAHGNLCKEVPRKNSFYEHTITCNQGFSKLNHQDNPKAFKRASDLYQIDLRFYAGLPLLTPTGLPIAVLSVFDTKLRELTIEQINSLKALGNQCMNLFEFQKQNHKLQVVQLKLLQKYKDLEKFASLVSHDIKSPLANIISLTELLKDENQGKFDGETLEYFDFLVESSYSLRNYVDGILKFYRSDHVFENEHEDVDLHALLKGIASLYKVADDVEISYPDEGLLHHVNKAALSQVFMNLISNALKYNSKEKRHIWISFTESEKYYHFEVKDNGNGISTENIDKIFDLFTTLDLHDREGNPGSGIGLATVKKHIENMKGSIKVESEPGVGSTFKFKIRRL